MEGETPVTPKKESEIGKSNLVGKRKIKRKSAGNAPKRSTRPPTTDFSDADSELRPPNSKDHNVKERREARKTQLARRLEQSQRLLRQILLKQEDERKKISRDLHDMVAQMLTGINFRLAILKQEAACKSKDLEREIASTQSFVRELVGTVHDFARELRPLMLDDVGLIPTLHSFMKEFSSSTGIRAHLTAFAGVEQFGADLRTVLFRIAQESLTNVARHANASRVEVNIVQTNGSVLLEIKDDGKSFHVKRVLNQKNKKTMRLGLLGMRERVEMIGGSFSIESSSGKGTTIRAEMPIQSPPERRKKLQP